MLRVNVSPAQLVAHDLVNTVERTIDEFGLDGSSLGLEITESIVIRDVENTRATLMELRQLEWTSPSTTSAPVSAGWAC